MATISSEAQRKSLGEALDATVTAMKPIGPNPGAKAKAKGKTKAKDELKDLQKDIKAQLA